MQTPKKKPAKKKVVKKPLSPNHKTPFIVGNNYASFRNTMGRDYDYTPEQLMEVFQKYEQWLDENPLMETKVFQYQGQVVTATVPRMRTPSRKSFCLYADISKQTLSNYESNPVFFGVIDKIIMAIDCKMLEGAAAEQLNPNIIARVLGLADKQESTITGDAVTVNFITHPKPKE